MILVTDEWEPWMDDMPEHEPPGGIVDAVLKILEGP